MTDEVRQEDREAAADAVKAYRDQKNGNWQQRIRDGLCDDGEMVQAFVRHGAPLRSRALALEGFVRAVAEGNLGDQPWQANYDRLKELATVTLNNTPHSAGEWAFPTKGEWEAQSEEERLETLQRFYARATLNGEKKDG